MSVAQKDGIKAAAGISYDDLYRRWEQSNWQATAIDFGQDREGWAGLTDIQRRSALWIYSMFFYGEDSVTDNLSPYIDAAPKEEQKYFLATQQVDEARHAVFFHRFFKEVIGAGDSIASTLAYTESAARLGLPQRLRPARPDGRRPAPRPLAAQLRPRDRALPHGRRGDARPARPALHRGLLRRRRARCPGSARGWRTSRATSSATSASGSRCSRECFAESDECKAGGRRAAARAAPLHARGLLAGRAGARVHPRLRLRARGHLFTFGLASVRTKWRATGYPMEEMPGVLPVDPALTPDEVARPARSSCSRRA